VSETQRDGRRGPVAKPVESERTMSTSPIEDYGVIGDLETVALVSSEGAIDYMCFPHFDSPTIFAALLHPRDGGSFEISPVMRHARRKQLYLPDTNVLLTRFLAEEGVAEITDFMPVGEIRHTHVIVRRVTGVRGPVRFRVRCAPRFDYARVEHDVEQGEDEIIFTPRSDTGQTMLRLRAPVPLEIANGAAVGEFSLAPGETVDFVLEAVRPDWESMTATPGWVDRAFEHTVGFWRRWSGRSSYRGRWWEMVTRSALVLRLLTSHSQGSIAAAGTFGLPERAGGERNWDYRFTWIRDASLAAATLLRLGYAEEARRFLSWVHDRYGAAEERGKLQIMYTINGRADLEEEVLENLTGNRHSTPVRIGNAAARQLQLDIYGELLHLVDLYDERVERISYDFWCHVVESVDWVCEHWREPDEGIWEVRGGRQEFLYSRLMDWVCLDRAIRIARRRALPAPLERWERVRNEIHSDIYHDFWNEEVQAFVQHKGSATLDAACLLMPMLDFISSHDPRWLSTLAAVERELVDDALVYRYRVEQAAADGLLGGEGTFSMCSYWYAECVARSGDVEKARLLFEKMQGYANHLGLYAEELDATGRHLGNFPQAFTHLGLVSAALYLDHALDRAERTA
jgi:GH15 family glucan-1,4-alpha-glucosidase